MSLSGKKILLAVTGSIAAYKSALLIRLLVKSGAEVRVIMTKDATSFITPLTLSTLSKNKVLTDLVDDKEPLWNSHVELGLWADLMLVAPASANSIAKLANGICDNLLTAVYLSVRCPVGLAPAMDEDMWKHPATQRNIALLEKDKVQIISVATGELASGLYGPGRMSEPETIFDFAKSFFSQKATSKKKLLGKKALVTAGPTFEAIDPVRYIGNHSSGKMGIALAEALADEGADVKLILGPSALTPENTSIKISRITSAHEMYEATNKYFPGSDITIMAAAVSDYSPQLVSADKIKKKNGAEMNIVLNKTPDILKELGRQKKKNQLLVGFALETNDEVDNAIEKMDQKNLDFIVLNSLNDSGAGFRHDTNKITIIDRRHRTFPFPLKSKRDVARDIVNFIIQPAK